MRTQDISSVTNSVMMAIDKELRKNGLAPAGHRLMKDNRAIIQDLMSRVIADARVRGEIE